MNKNASISLMGDVALECANTPIEFKHEIQYLKLFEQVIPIINKTDLVLLNLEGPFSVNNYERKNKVNLSNSPDIISLFPNKYKVFNLCNNHIFDYGTNSFLHTRNVLEQNNIFTTGAGINSASASEPTCLNVNGIKVCFLGYSSGDPHIGSKIADEKNPGVISYVKIECVKASIERCKKQSDFVCIILHWGKEYFQYPEPWQIDYARRLIDYGASVIIGHHPHVMQGHEYYKDGLILYSIGNMFLPPIYSGDGIFQVSPKETSEFIIYQITLNKSCRPVISDIITGRTDSKSIIVDDQRCNKKSLKKNKKLSKMFQYTDYQNFYKSYEIKRMIYLKLYKKLNIIRKLKHTPLRLLLKKLDLSRLHKRFSVS